ncbi:MAG: hypothetical protein ACLQMO_08725 [Acidobacteriaceae bacterium]
MSPWVPIGVTIVVCLLNIAIGFYARLVPIEVQRQHLRRSLFWAAVIWDGAAAIVFIVSLIHFWRTPPPPTINTVFGIALDFVGLATIGWGVTIYLAFRLMGRNLKNTGGIIDALDKHLQFIKENFDYSMENRKALQLLASSSPEIAPETAAQIKKLLNESGNALE